MKCDTPTLPRRQAAAAPWRARGLQRGAAVRHAVQRLLELRGRFGRTFKWSRRLPYSSNDGLIGSVDPTALQGDLDGGPPDQPLGGRGVLC